MARLELPTFQLNVIRRRLKALGYIGQATLGKDGEKKGLVTSISEGENKDLVKRVSEELGNLLKESNAGIIDLGDKEMMMGSATKSSAKPTVTQTLGKTANKVGESLKNLIDKPKAKMAEEGDAAGEAKKDEGPNF